MNKFDRLIVFGIGGSGERVMRSLVMLLAGGMEMNCNSIQPVLIDSDEKSKALQKVCDLITANNKMRELYDITQNYVKDELVKKNSMFHVRIEKPVILNVSGTNVETLKKLVDSTNLDRDLKAEFDILYSEKSQNMRLSWGFVGNPSIGAVVLNQMLEGEKYKSLNITSRDGVFIISSIFGGTGAAGFPLLVNKIRKDLEGNMEHFKIGALSLFPYFSLVETTDDSEVAKGLKGYEVNDNEFSTKTKAALAYYDSHVKALCSIYYLGTGDVSYRSRFPKYKGGEKQDNPASMLELIGAKAVSHFTFSTQEITGEIANNDFKFPGGAKFTNCYEYFIDKRPENGTAYDLNTIDADIKFREVFVRLQLLKYIWRDCVPEWLKKQGLQWSTSIGINQGRYDNMRGNYLERFFDMFEDWKKELNHNYHNSGFRFKFFNDNEATAEGQDYITERFHPAIAYREKSIFSSIAKVKDPEILGKMQAPCNSNIGKGFNSDEIRYKFAFYTSLYAIEHIIKDTDKNRCINLDFV